MNRRNIKKQTSLASTIADGPSSLQCGLSSLLVDSVCYIMHSVGYFLNCIRVGLKFANEMVIPMWAPLNFTQKMLLKLSNFSSDLFLKSQLTTFFFRVGVF